MTGDTATESDASPLGPEFVAAFEKAVKAAWGDVPIYPTQSSGASDSMWYRALGVPSYGASASFIKESDDFAHGLNERIPLSNIRPASPTTSRAGRARFALAAGGDRSQRRMVGGWLSGRCERSRSAAVRRRGSGARIRPA